MVGAVLKRRGYIRGFTLIELSIVLVVIGLIVGGIVVGQTLVSSAAVRAQISQIEKYDSAANTFRGKYGGLPGDLTATPAGQFGFTARASSPGQGDGNGILEGWDGCVGNRGQVVAGGETATFWVDLATTHLIDGNFNTASETVATTTYAPSLLMPAAKFGNGTFIFALSSGNVGYFVLQTVINTTNCADWKYVTGDLYGGPAITAKQAYTIDSKIDDGIPQSGNVIAGYMFADPSADPYFRSAPNGNFDTSATCFNTTTNLYSVSSSANYGMGTNCGLAFKMQ